MTKQIIYVCDVCNKSFKDELKAEAHEKKCIEDNALKEYKKKNYHIISDELRLSLSSWENNDINIALGEWMKKYYDISSRISVSLSYNHSVSNSHSHPINGVENWHRKKNLPLGSPGFHGRIEIDFETKKDCNIFSSSDMFSNHSNSPELRNYNPKLQGFHTGSGGGNENHLFYEFYMFIEDFPVLQEKWISYYAANLLKEM